jgi:hypothetical protein
MYEISCFTGGRLFYLERRGNGSVVWSFIMPSAHHIWVTFCMGDLLEGEDIRLKYEKNDCHI